MGIPLTLTPMCSPLCNTTRRRFVKERMVWGVGDASVTKLSSRTRLVRVLATIGEEARAGSTLEVRGHGIAQEVKRGAALLGTADHDGPNAFAPALPGLAACPLSHAAVDGHETDGLLCQVVGGLHIRRGDEAEVAVHVHD